MHLLLAETTTHTACGLTAASTFMPGQPGAVAWVPRYLEDARKKGTLQAWVDNMRSLFAKPPACAHCLESLEHLLIAELSR
jgi:hypothetical protein